MRSLTMPQDDDHSIVYKSHAVVRYFGPDFLNHVSKLIPTGSKENALFDQAASIELSYCDSHPSKAVFEKVTSKAIAHDILESP